MADDPPVRQIPDPLLICLWLPTSVNFGRHVRSGIFANA